MSEPVLWSVRCPAKVNLQLRILGRRDDGYHEVETCLHALELSDRLAARLAPPGRSIRLRVTAADDALASVREQSFDVPTDASNLVWRAALHWAEAAGLDWAESPGIDFELTKRIPAGAGLGGGSSDAAGALKLLQAMAGRLGVEPLPLADLHRIGAALGADVPFFLVGGTQWGRGRGDQLTAVPADAAPTFEFVLLLPGFGASTVAIYRKYAELRSAPAVGDRLTESRDADTMKTGSIDGIGVCDDPSRFVNDLEEAARLTLPGLDRLQREVGQRGFHHVRMSGSGSTLFVTFGSAKAADAALDALGRGVDGMPELVWHVCRTRSDRVPTGGHPVEEVGGAGS